MGPPQIAAERWYGTKTWSRRGHLTCEARRQDERGQREQTFFLPAVEENCAVAGLGKMPRTGASGHRRWCERQPGGGSA